MAGSNRKNLARQLGLTIPTDAPMTLHATTVALTASSPCVTCGKPIEPGQRVRWCIVVGYVPAGYIHALHFDAGPLDVRSRTPRRKRRSKRPIGPCSRHQWGPWHRAGIFDSTEIPTCRYCPATRTRSGRQLGSSSEAKP
jgi:hypothetical protein